MSEPTLLTNLSVVLLQIDFSWEGIQEYVTNAFNEALKGLISPISEAFEFLVQYLMQMVILPPLPPGAKSMIQTAGANDLVGSSVIGDSLWAGMVSLNQEMTAIAAVIFPIILLVYIIAAGIGFLDGDFGANMFKMVLAYIFLLANRPLLDLFYATVGVIAWAILEMSAVSSSGLEGIYQGLGSVVVTVVAGVVVSLGYGVTIAAVFFAILLILFILMFGVHIIGMIGYGIFPLLVITYMAGEIFDFAEEMHENIVGFFIPPMYSPIMYAIIFKIAAFFMTTGFGYGGGTSQFDESAAAGSTGGGAIGGSLQNTGGVSTGGGGVDLLGNVVQGIIGPFVFIIILILGFWFVTKNMKAGSAIISGAKTAATAAVGAGMVAATGGAGAASAGQGAMKGMMHGGGVKSMAAGAITEMQRDEDVDTDITGGALEKAGDKVEELNEKGSVAGVAARKTGAATLAGKARDAVSWQDTEELTEGELSDEELNAHNEPEITPEKGREEFDEQFETKQEGVMNDSDDMNSVGDIENYLQRIANAIEEQGGVDDGDAVANDLQQDFQKRAQKLQQRDDMSRDEAMSEAMKQAIQTNDDIEDEDLGTLAFSRKMRDGEIRNNNEILDDIYSDNRGMAGEFKGMDDDLRRRYVQRPAMAGLTGDPSQQDHKAANVELNNPGEDATQKEEALGADVDSANLNNGDDFKLQSVENGKVKYNADGENEALNALTNIGDRDDDELNYNNETGEWEMDADAFTEAMDDVDFDSVDATGDREAMMKVEQIDEQHESAKEEIAKNQIETELENNFAIEGITGSIQKRLQRSSTREEDAREIIEGTERMQKYVTDSAYQNEVDTENVDSAYGGFDNAFAPDATKVATGDDLRNNTEDGDAVALEGQVKRQFDDSYMVDSMSTGSGGTFELGFDNETVKRQVDDKFDDVDNLSNKRFRVDNADANMNDGSPDEIVVTDESQLTVEETPGVNSDTKQAFSSVSGVNEAQLTEVKESVIESTGTDMNIMTKVSQDLNDGADMSEASQSITDGTNLNKSQGEAVVRVAAANKAGGVDESVVDNMINNAVDTNANGAMQTAQLLNHNKSKMQQSPDVSISDLDGWNNVKGLSATDVKNAIKDFNQIRLNGGGSGNP